jgi:hypothetical protein
MLDQNQIWILIILLWLTSFIAGVFGGIWAALWRKPQRQTFDPTKQPDHPMEESAGERHRNAREEVLYSALRGGSPLSTPPSEQDTSKKS